MSERDDLFGDDSQEEKKPLKRREDEEFFFDIDEEDLQGTESRDEDAPEDIPEDFMSSEEVPPIVETDEFGDEELPAEPFPSAEPEPVVVAEKNSDSRSKLLLLLLLVVALCGGGYFYLGDMLFVPEPEPAQPVVKSQAQKMKVPQRKEVKKEQAAVKEEVMPAEKVATASPEKPVKPAEQPTQDGKPAPDKAVKPAPAEQAMAKPEKASAEKQAVAAVSKKEPTTTAKPKTSASEKPAAKAQPEPVAAMKNAPYTLQIGSFVLESNLNQALKTVKSLGYQPTIIEGMKDVVMMRLKVGSYPPAEAREKLQEIRPVAPAAFLLKEGDLLTVYAGSYYITDRARAQADRLFQHEIRVDEVRVDVSVPIRSIRFGAFDSSASAEQAVGQAKQAGLETLVIKQN